MLNFVNLNKIVRINLAAKYGPCAMPTGTTI